MPCVRLCVRVVSVRMQRKQRQKQKGIEVFFVTRAGKRPPAVTTGAATRHGRALRPAGDACGEATASCTTCMLLPTRMEGNARGPGPAAGNAPIAECPASRGTDAAGTRDGMRVRDAAAPGWPGFRAGYWLVPLRCVIERTS